MYRNYEDDDDRPQQTQSGSFKVPDRDFYRKNFSTFTSVANHFHQRLYMRNFRERRWDQPHSVSMVNVRTPYGNVLNPADGICMHFLRRGFTKPQKVLFNTALWSADARWLVLGTQHGDLILWESEALKVHKLISIPAHKVIVDGDRVKESIPITAMAWKHFGNLMVTGDERGLIQYCDETFRNVRVTKDAHEKAVRGLSFSPLDTKLVSCSDDARIHLWSVGRDKPELVLTGHQADIKCIDWHPYRSLIASGARDTMVKLWDPKSGGCVSTITGHKKQVNCCSWNMNGNWLATGSTDGLVKLYDIRVMKEVEVWRGQNSEVCRIAWHPMHESLLVSGGFNGSLVYWICGQNQSPHSIITEAHRQSIDVLTWHPSGHTLASSSHDCIIKFWSREPPGSRLETPPTSEVGPENLPTYVHGPIAPGSYSIPVRAPSNNAPMPSQMQAQFPGGGRGSGMMGRGGRGHFGGGRGGGDGHYGGGRGGDGGRKRSRDQY